MKANIGFYGATGVVTGSCFVVEVEGEKIMVDCGMYQGKNAVEMNKEDFGFDVKQIKKVLLTHAHLDHCGRLPLLVKRGYEGKILATKPTRDLVELVLYDAAKVASYREEDTGVEALYEEEDVRRTMERFEVVKYLEEVKVMERVEAKWYDAGHILGSASVMLILGEEREKVVFSGDLGNWPSPLVKVTDIPEEAEVVVMETTYGDRLHEEKRGEEMEVFEKLSKEIEKTQGTLLIPAFSLERTQEILHIYDHLKKEGRVSNELTVYLDSPMGLRATAVFESYKDYFNPALRQHFNADDPFDFPGLVLVATSGESKKINKTEGAKVIIAGSGMMSGGRIMNHAKRWLGDDRTILLITGFQAKGTLGRELQEGVSEVVVEGKRIMVKARIEEVASMSAHGDQSQLLEWLKGIKGVREVILVHGEDEARGVMEEKIKSMGLKVVIPKKDDKVVIS